MKTRYVIAVTLLTFWPRLALSQDAQRDPEKHDPPPVSRCFSLESLSLSKEQRDTLVQIDGHFKDRILQNRHNLMIKHIELRDRLRDPDAEKAVIYAKSDEIKDLRDALQKDLMDYQIRVRAMLTPEQIRNWCTMIGPFQEGRQRASWFR